MRIRVTRNFLVAILSLNRIKYNWTERMILYHGTSTALLDEILKKGLIANRYDNWEHTSSSKKGFIYLTSTYATYFAMVCVSNLGGDPVVIEVDVSKKCLYPDEDFFACALNNVTERVIGESSQERIIRLAKETDINELKDYWKGSLDTIGNVAHKGNIKPSRIKRYCEFTDKRLQYNSMDASISMLNFKLCGNWYRQAIKAAFGDITLEEFWQVPSTDLTIFD